MASRSAVAFSVLIIGSLLVCTMMMWDPSPIELEREGNSLSGVNPELMSSATREKWAAKQAAKSTARHVQVSAAGEEIQVSADLPKGIQPMLHQDSKKWALVEKTLEASKVKEEAIKKGPEKSAYKAEIAKAISFCKNFKVNGYSACGALFCLYQQVLVTHKVKNAAGIPTKLTKSCKGILLKNTFFKLPKDMGSLCSVYAGARKGKCYKKAAKDWAYDKCSKLVGHSDGVCLARYKQLRKFPAKEAVTKAAALDKEKKVKKGLAAATMAEKMKQKCIKFRAGDKSLSAQWATKVPKGTTVSAKETVDKLTHESHVNQEAATLQLKDKEINEKSVNKKHKANLLKTTLELEASQSELKSKCAKEAKQKADKNESEFSRKAEKGDELKKKNAKVQAKKETELMAKRVEKMTAQKAKQELATKKTDAASKKEKGAKAAILETKMKAKVAEMGVKHKTAKAAAAARETATKKAAKEQQGKALTTTDKKKEAAAKTAQAAAVAAGNKKKEAAAKTAQAAVAAGDKKKAAAAKETAAKKTAAVDQKKEAKAKLAAREKAVKAAQEAKAKKHKTKLQVQEQKTGATIAETMESRAKKNGAIQDKLVKEADEDAKKKSPKKKAKKAPPAKPKKPKVSAKQMASMIFKSIVKVDKKHKKSKISKEVAKKAAASSRAEAKGALDSVRAEEKHVKASLKNAKATDPLATLDKLANEKAANMPVPDQAKQIVAKDVKA